MAMTMGIVRVAFLSTLAGGVPPVTITSTCDLTNSPANFPNSGVTLLEVYETLPIVPLRDVVVFPHMMMPFVIGRPSSIRAL